MKLLNYSLSLAAFCLLSGCFFQKELPVEYDYSYKGRFDKYKSYDFIQTQNRDTSLNSLYIQSAIEKHMGFLGYKFKDSKPDLLLNFMIYNDSLNFKGYNQPDITEWVRRPDRDLNYDRRSIKMANGTLLIQVFDRKQNASIWQGYATDEYTQLDFEDYQQVKNAVRSILNKYQFFADGFLEAQEALQKESDN